MIRVRTGSRLHLGLLDPAGICGRRYGGAGVMLDEPGVEVEVKPAAQLEVTGPLAERALGFITRYLENQSKLPGSTARATATVRVLRSPRDHVGLGTGTQLALAVAAGLSLLRDESRQAIELARFVGRGKRSAIGVHGFAHGGFLVEGGKSPEDGISPLITRLRVPTAWRFVLVVPRGPEGISGHEEQEAFRQLSPYDGKQVEALRRLLLDGLVPAMTNADLARASEALYAYSRLAGKPFRQKQGGDFASELVNDVVSFCRREGVAGSGQSSWGPTSYALVADEEQGRNLAERIRRRFGLSEDEVMVSPGRNDGATIRSQN